MYKTVKIKSSLLRTLNETIQKLQINGLITEASPVIAEANGNFTSVLKAQDNFDPNQLGSEVSVDETEKTEDNATKEQLINQAAEAIKQSLDASEDLNTILRKMKDLAKDTDYNQWQINEEGNTATLKSKNARIFKQNNKLCLSHNGKVELFNNISELHNWLKENNYPLPGNIEIHESVELVEEESRNWYDLLNDDKFIVRDGKRLEVGDTIEIDPKEQEELNQKQYWAGLRNMSTDDYKQAMKFIDKKKLNQPKIKGLPTDECVGGAVTTSSLGAATIWTGNKKSKNESVELKEIYGFANTPFANKQYTNPYTRGKDYLSWLRNDPENAKYTDLETFDNVVAYISSKTLNDVGHKAWNDMFPMEILSDPAKLSAKIKEVNEKYDLDLTINEPVRSIKIGKESMGTGKHNSAERAKWIKGFFAQNKETIMKSKQKLQKELANIRSSIENNSEKQTLDKEVEIFTNQDVNGLATRLLTNHDEMNATDFFNLLQTKLKKLPPKQRDIVLTQLIKAAEETPEPYIDASDFEVAVWKSLLSKKESVLVENITKDSRFSKLVGSVLKEEDTPADFATGNPIDTNVDMTTNTTTTTSTTPETSTDDFISDDVSSDENLNFGDINISGGSGYSPETNSEEEIAIPNTPNFTIIDVLVNDDDPSDIKVKLKNTETDEIEIKNLSEIDV